ncbi:MAG: hypothetical protein EOO07_06280 [Chitinophagaceae bacterium]|nr:MAG: hypothetical protein EOO07_06280 [Chitinophagaceae bacterium]
MKLLIVLSSLCLFLTTPKITDLKDLHFLAGTWKVEKKESYENWTLNAKGALEGSSYKIKNGTKQIDEYLSIKISDIKIIYTAKVVNQNDGKPIEFILNTSVKDKLSFENLAHDFPKKIQYTKRNDTTLFVSVLGKDDKGFSYNLIKQK